MKIVMLSTRHGRGLTTTSILLADMCARAVSVPCIVAHTDSSDPTMDKYLNLSKSKDPTMSIRQVYKLLEVNQINGEKLSDYTVKRGNLQIFDIYDPNYIQGADADSDVDASGKSSQLLDLVLSENVRGLSFVDMTGEIYEPTMQRIISDGDFYIIVIDQSVDNIDQLKEWQKYKYFTETIAKEGYLVLVNQFNNNNYALDKIAKMLNIRRSSMMKIGYNPMIVKHSNEGNLHYVNDYALNGDPRYIATREDLLSCVSLLTSHLGLTMNKGIKKLNG